MSLQSILNPTTAKPSTMEAQDQLAVTEQLKVSSSLPAKNLLGAPAFGAPAFGAPAFGAPAFGAPAFGGTPFGAQPNPAPVTAQPSASVKIFGDTKDQAPGPICGKNLSSDGVLSFGALTKSTQPIDSRPESNKHTGETKAKFIRDDVILYFLDSWEVTLANWMLLLHKTALPEDGIYSVQQMATAVNTLESVIAGQELLPPKFGYLQLSNFLDALETRIQRQKINGDKCKGKSATTIALDRYLALQGHQGKKSGKDALSYKRKVGRRWKELVSPSSLLLLAFSDAAEDVVKIDYKNPFEGRSLENFAIEMYKIIPENLLYTCIHVSGVAEMAVKIGKGWDIPRVKEFRHQVSKLL